MVTSTRNTHTVSRTTFEDNALLQQQQQQRTPRNENVSLATMSSVEIHRIPDDTLYEGEMNENLTSVSSPTRRRKRVQFVDVNERRSNEGADPLWTTLTEQTCLELW